MSTSYRYLGVVVTITLFLSACGSQAGPAQQSLRYGDMLGKSLDDLVVMQWMAANHCVNANQFQLCKDTGVAFWLDAEQVVKKIYLYLNNEEGFTPYKGELPLGLKFYDTMGAVQYKLGKIESVSSLQTTENAGAPDEGISPDHMHYWAVYKRYGITIVYNSSLADEDATIYAIVVTNEKGPR
jgi:hypothetical protein